jgi:hypothetical protein
MPLNLPCGQTTSIQAQDLGIEVLQPPLALGDQLRLKTPVPVAWHGKLQRSRARLHRLLALAIPGIPILGPVAHVGGIAQVDGQLGF